MDLSVWILICLMAICTSAEVESKPKSGRGKGSMWWYVNIFFYLNIILHKVTKVTQSKELFLISEIAN